MNTFHNIGKILISDPISIPRALVPTYRAAMKSNGIFPGCTRRTSTSTTIVQRSGQENTPCDRTAPGPPPPLLLPLC